MPPRLSDYRLSDWFRFRPPIHRLKTMRYRTNDRRYRALSPPVMADLDAALKRIRQRKVLVTVAFNDQQTIAWQTALLRHFVPHALSVVVDNSTDEAAATEIE